MFDISVSRCCAEKSPWGFGTITCTVRFTFGVSTRYSISLFRDVALRRVLECLVQLHVDSCSGVIYWMFDISVSRCHAEKSPWGFGTITCTVRFMFGVSTGYSISLFRDEKSP